MIIKNVLLKGNACNIVIKDGVISEIFDASSPFCEKDNEILDAGGLSAIAGLIDVHTHGMLGVDTLDADFEKLCFIYASHGTTSFLPTTMTVSADDITCVTASKTDFYGANVLGFHLEGPFISPKYKGAQDENNIIAPNLAIFRKFNNVRMITVAPEITGAIDFIREVSGSTIVSIGHTDCDCETAVNAIDNGALCLTHTFNAMPPMLHRAPGPIGAGVEKHIFAQIICDGLHVQKAAFLAAYRMFGSDRLCLISDSIRPAKLPDGEYESGGIPVFVKDGEIRLADGKLAGSSACLLDCVKKAIEFGIPKDEAIKMATETPANLLGVKKGSVRVGFDADILLVDDNLNLKKVIIGGKIFAA